METEWMKWMEMYGMDTIISEEYDEQWIEGNEWVKRRN